MTSMEHNIPIELFDAMPGAIAVISGTGELVLANRQYKSWAQQGVAFAECVDDPMNCLDAWDAATGPGADTARALATAVRNAVTAPVAAVSLEYMVEEGDETRWFSIGISSFDWAGARCALVIQEDISDWKRTQGEAHLFKSIFDQATLEVLVLNISGKIIYVNTAFAASHGYVPESLVGQDVSCLHDQEQMKAMADAHAVLQQCGEFSAFEIWHTHQDGHAFPMLMQGMLVRGTLGEPAFLAFTGFEITENRRQEKVEQGEEPLYSKRNVCIASEAGVGHLRLTDILNHEAIQGMMEEFYRLTGIGIAMVDRQGNVLVATGWQDVCTRFHRVHPEMCAQCRESDVVFPSGVAPGETKLYRCKNNMWEMVTPIVVEGHHLGNLFLGQFFFEDETLDYDLFRQQARAFGLEEEAYIAALDRVPRWKRETVSTVMAFYARFAELIANLGYSNVRLARVIDERNDLLHSLRISEEMYRQLVESANSIILRFNRAGTITFINKYGQQFFGFRQDEILGKTLLDTIVPKREETGRGLEEMITDLFTHPECYETNINQNRRKDGIKMWVAWTNRALKDEAGNVIEMLSIGQDISELKKTEAHLAEHTRLLERIFEVLPVGLWFTDPNGVLLRGNPAGVAIWGAEPHVGVEHYGVFKAWRLPGHEEMKPEQWALARTIREGVTVKDELLEIEAFDGTRKTILNYTAPVMDEDGRIQGAIVVNLDVTDLREAEEALSESRKQLQQAQKLESVGRLAGGVAHDFNNMLQTILGHAEMAMLLVAEDTEIHGYLSEVMTAAERSASLTSQLLAFARRQVIRPKLININDHIVGALKMLGRLIGENIELAFKPCAHDPVVKMDQSQVDQILANLVVNARDAISGVGAVTIEIKNIEAGAGNHQYEGEFLPGPYVQLSVCDTGCGMDEETQRLIFEPFFTTKEVGKGTGLGLATVYGIIQQNNGFIQVISEVGVGTTLRVCLPRYEERLQQPEHKAKRQNMPVGTETILIVEDEPAVLRLGKTLLANLGYAVLEADTPARALELATAHEGPIQALVTDVIMPQMDGRSLYEQLRQVHPGLKCLYMSGYTDDFISEQGELEADAHFMQKPFTRSVLAHKLRDILDEQETS